MSGTTPATDFRERLEWLHKDVMTSNVHLSRLGPAVAAARDVAIMIERQELCPHPEPHREWETSSHSHRVRMVMCEKCRKTLSMVDV